MIAKLAGDPIFAKLPGCIISHSKINMHVAVLGWGLKTGRKTNRKKERKKERRKTDRSTDRTKDRLKPLLLFLISSEIQGAPMGLPIHFSVLGGAPPPQTPPISRPSASQAKK